jgi:hypothetical protein
VQLHRLHLVRRLPKAEGPAANATLVEALPNAPTAACLSIHRTKGNIFSFLALALTLGAMHGHHARINPYIPSAIASVTRITPRKALLDAIALNPAHTRTQYTPRIRAHDMLRVNTQSDRGTTWAVDTNGRWQVLSGEHRSICFPRLPYPARSGGYSQRKLLSVTAAPVRHSKGLDFLYELQVAS